MKIEKLPSGTYRARVYIGKRDGRSVYKSITHQDPKRLRVMAAEYAADNHDPEDAQTVGGMISAYIDAKTAILSPSTVKAYQAMAKTLKTAYFGFCGLSAGNVRKKDYQGLVNALHRDGKSAKYIKNLTSLISAALAYYDYQVPAVTIPTIAKPPKDLPADRDILNLIIYTDTHGLQDLCLAVCLALFCGLRRSEICALEASDLSGGMLTISKALVLGPDRKWHLKTTKTAQSVRVIPVQDDIQDAIRAQGSGRIIPCNPDALRNRFERAISNSGVTPFTFHQLRHKFASDLMLQGIPDVYIEYLGGWKHGSQVLKRTYQQAEKDRAADMLRSVW
jgi:integrase